MSQAQSRYKCNGNFNGSETDPPASNLHLDLHPLHQGGLCSPGLPHNSGVRHANFSDTLFLFGNLIAVRQLLGQQCTYWRESDRCTSSFLFAQSSLDKYQGGLYGYACGMQIISLPCTKLLPGRSRPWHTKTILCMARDQFSARAYARDLDALPQLRTTHFKVKIHVSVSRGWHADTWY
jgi:hypothetical protein